MTICAIASLTFAQSCDNKDEFDVENAGQEFVDRKDFVNTDKGDVGKDTVLLISTKDIKSRLKSTQELYIRDLTLIRNAAYSPRIFPESFKENGLVYYKLNYDLNKGAGGDYIYLYYAVTSNPYEAVSYLHGYSTKRGYGSEKSLRDALGIHSDYRIVHSDEEPYTDLNAHSGGWWVYLIQTNHRPKEYPQRAITEVLVEISSTEIRSTMFDFNGKKYLHIFDFEENERFGGASSTFYPLDFNKGTTKHEKYIYLATD